MIQNNVINNDLIIKAKEAKKRLKTKKYIQFLMDFKDDRYSDATIKYITRENKKLLIPDNEKNEDEILWEKVCKIMESDSPWDSPISKLMDKKKMAAMDDIQKQVYILTLTNKFSELKERYQKERRYHV